MCDCVLASLSPPEFGCAHLKVFSLQNFDTLGLAAPILKALIADNYTKPTPIQAQAIPLVLAGNDLLGLAQTGTGKTAAFALPMLNHLWVNKRRASPKACRALILSPTRELASQIEASFRAYGRHLPLTSKVLFGGMPLGRQIREVSGGVDIIVATPGRLLDLVKQRALTLNEVEIFVLDEADQMLDMGFINDIRKLITYLPKQRQNLFFSATMPKAMADLAGSILRNPSQVAVNPVASTAERVTQGVIFVEQGHKQAVLHHLMTTAGIERGLVFSRTKHGADRIVKNLRAAGFPAEAIHGNKSQAQRERALEAFRAGHSKLLVATDIAARGIDIDGISHVINFDLPNVPESYVHRIGRTARAGAAGEAISFCAGDERVYLRDIERLTKQIVPVLETPMGLTPVRSAAPIHKAASRPQGQRPQGQRQDGQRQDGQRQDGHRPDAQRHGDARRPEGNKDARRPDTRPDQRPNRGANGNGPNPNRPSTPHSRQGANANRSRPVQGSR